MGQVMARAITGAAILFTAQTKPAEEGFQRMRHKSQDFNRNLDAARNHTRQFGSEVTGFSGRASQQFGGIVGDLDRVAGRTGSAAEAFRILGNQAGVAGRVIGSGGAFGVAIAAGLGLVAQIRNEVKEFREELEETIKKLDDLQQKRIARQLEADRGDVDPRVAALRAEREELLTTLRELEDKRTGAAQRARDAMLGDLPGGLDFSGGPELEATIARTRQQMAHVERLIALRRQEAQAEQERERAQSRRMNQLQREISQQMESEQAAIAAGRKARERADAERQAAMDKQREHFEGMKSSAEALEKSLRTPFERAVDDVRELREMMRTLGPAFLSPEIVGRRMAQIRQQIREMVEGETPGVARERGVGGVRLGEAAGFSALQEARRAERTASQERQRQTAVLGRVEELIGRLVDAVEQSEDVTIDMVDLAR